MPNSAGEYASIGPQGAQAEVYTPRTGWAAVSPMNVGRYVLTLTSSLDGSAAIKYNAPNHLPEHGDSPEHYFSSIGVRRSSPNELEHVRSASMSHSSPCWLGRSSPIKADRTAEARDLDTCWQVR